MRKLTKSKPIKLLFVLFAIGVCSISAVAQNNITVDFTKQPLRTVLEAIEKQSGHTFSFSDNVVDTHSSVSIHMKNASLESVLADISKQTGLKYEVVSKDLIVVSYKAIPINKKGGKRALSGTVKDGKDGEPLIGAVVRVQGDDKNAALVDADGNFTINIDETSGKKPVLEISYIGYNKREVPVGDLNHVDVNMTGAANTLDEVIVVGSGTQKKVSVTGSISTVNGDALKMPTARLSRALGGRIAGVITRQDTGDPNSGAEFYIRGISTFGGKSTPLILLDDVEISATDLDYIPAENIESFTVLKDASATAIYGARGANGVMIVTTKGGDYNTKTKINISVENSFNFIHKAPEFVDGVDFMNFYNWVNEARNPGSKPIYSDLQIERTASGVNPYLYPNVDWKKELMRDMAMRQRANLNVSGGGSKAKYYMSLEAQHENGIQKTDKIYSWDNNPQIYNYTFQNNISYKLTSSTNLALNLNAQIRQITGPTDSSETIFRWIGEQSNSVLFPVFYPTGPNGEVRFGSKIQGQNYAIINPRANIDKTFKKTKYNTINAVLKFDQDLKFITQGLKLNAWVNWKAYGTNSYTRTFEPYMYYVDVRDEMDPTEPYELQIINPAASQFINESTITHSGTSTFELQANVNWARKFGQNDITAMVMYRMREYYGKTVIPNRNMGLSGRITYDYGHRYLAEFNFGYNGTERLAKHNRFGFFPAGSLGWVVSNEKFWEPLSNTITHFKLRGSYGLVGSDDLASPNGSYFLYRDQVVDNNMKYIGWTTGDGNSSATGYGPLSMFYAMPDIVWEKSRKLDVGIDMSLCGDLNITAEYFREDRYDIFMQRATWPTVMGYGLAVPWANVGKARNEGFEASVNWNHAFTPELSVSLQGNITYNQNKYINKDEPEYAYPWKYSTGHPLDSYCLYGYIADGLFRSQEEIDNSPTQMVGSGTIRIGDIKYRDLNGDGKINADDKCMISKYSYNPRLMYGFGATVNWRKWDFGFFFTGTGCRTIYLNGKMLPGLNANQVYMNVHKWVYDNAFNPEKGNFDAEYPLPDIATGTTNNNQMSTYWLRNGSYLRLRSVELGWSFKYGRVYTSGLNLLCFSGFKLWDPELNTPYKYPLQRTINMGVQFNL